MADGSGDPAPSCGSSPAAAETSERRAGSAVRPTGSQPQRRAERPPEPSPGRGRVSAFADRAGRRLPAGRGRPGVPTSCFVAAVRLLPAAHTRACGLCGAAPSRRWRAPRRPRRAVPCRGDADATGANGCSCQRDSGIYSCALTSLHARIPRPRIVGAGAGPRTFERVLMDPNRHGHAPVGGAVADTPPTHVQQAAPVRAVGQGGPSVTVRQLAGSLRRELRGLFPQGVWVSGEIENIARPGGGNVFFNLVERRNGAGSGEHPAAVLPVTLFHDHKAHINDAMRSRGHTAPMIDGMQVRIHARVDVHVARGRLQLKMDGIDPDYTTTQIALSRDLLLRRLDAEGLLRQNAQLDMPEVPLRVGIVTALNSAAHQDIHRVLHRSGFAFELVEAHTAVQGPAAAAGIAEAIKLVAPRVQAVLVARGGGSKTDLAAFDHELVARTVATCPKPVIAGIGHDTDRSVTDETAHASCATPTAAAAFVVAAVEAWLQRLDAISERITVRSRQHLHTTAHRTDNAAQRLALCAAAVQRHNLARLDRSQARLVLAAGQRIDNAARSVDTAQMRLRALDPANALRRGWSITRTANGAIVRSVADACSGDQIITQLADGTLTSAVN